MAAIVYMAGFSAKDALIALSAAYEQESLAVHVSALKYAGYQAQEIGRGLKAAFNQRENEIANSFYAGGCHARDAILAIDAAYGISLALAARTVEQAGYPAAEVAEILREIERQRASRPGSGTIPSAAERVVCFRETLDASPPLKIYVYDIPEDLLYLRRDSITRDYFRILKDPKHGLPVNFDLSTRMLAKQYFEETAINDWTQQYGYEFLLYEGLKGSRLATDNPEEADFFLIPNFTTTIFTKLLKNVEFLGFKSMPFVNIHFPEILKIADRYMNAILDHITSGYPYFKRRGNYDHLLICTWDNGLGIDEKKSMWGYNVTHMINDETKERLKDVVPITYHGSRASRYFKANPCVIIPPFMNDFLVRKIRNDPRARNFSPAQRTQLSFFLGSPNHHPMRMTYLTHFGDDKDMLVNTPEMKTEKFEDIKYSSLFAICMEGYTPWTMRLTQAFLYGSIPVIISDNLILPFERFIDWDECSLRFSAREIPRLKSILKSIPKKKIARLQEGLAEYSDHILFDSDRPLFQQSLGSLILAELCLLKAQRERFEASEKHQRNELLSFPMTNHAAIEQLSPKGKEESDGLLLLHRE